MGRCGYNGGYGGWGCEEKVSRQSVWRVAVVVDKESKWSYSEGESKWDEGKKS